MRGRRWVLVLLGVTSLVIRNVRGMMGMGSRRNMMSGGGDGGRGVGRQGYLPPGYAMIDGEVVDMSNKMVQRVGGGGAGTQYFSWTDQRGPPVFRRREIDAGRRFIVFPDRNYLPGDGHYVVLRRFKHGVGSRRGGNIYEAFYLDLGDSINAMVTNFNSLSPAATFGGSLGGRRGLNGLAGLRMKRKIQNEGDEVVYLTKRAPNTKFNQSELRTEEMETGTDDTEIEKLDLEKPKALLNHSTKRTPTNHTN